MEPDDIETKSPCPACDACERCGGRGKIKCYACSDHPHDMPCPADAVCGVCKGEHLVTFAVRAAWLNSHGAKP